MENVATPDPLISYLETLIGSSLIREKLNELLPIFYERAERGEYPLLPQPDLDPSIIEEALRRATGQEIGGIEFFPLRGRRRKEDVAWDDFRKNTRGWLYQSLSPVSLQLMDTYGESINSRFDVYLGQGLSQGLRRYRRKKEILWRLHQSICHSLSRFLIFSAAGDIIEFIRLWPLVYQVLPRCIPLCQKREEPEIWIVACA